MLKGKDLAKMRGQVGSGQIDIFEPFFRFVAVNIGKGGFGITGFGGDNPGDPVSEKIAFIPSVLFNQAMCVTDDPP